MAGGVDLHTHTTSSDGTLRPRELVAEAARRGVRVLAVTDHDSTDGLAEAMDTAREHPPLTIVPGIEINCDVEGAEIHVLGYCMDYQAAWFQDFCRAQREERRARVVRTAERLAALGLPIDVERVFALVQEGSAGRPHIARVMLETSIWRRAGRPTCRARSSRRRTRCGCSGAPAGCRSSRIPASRTGTRSSPRWWRRA